MASKKSIIKNVYRENIDNIYRFFWYKFIDRYVAEDLTSETFLIFTEDVLHEKQIDNYTNYLYGIAKNIFLQKLKENYKRNEYSCNDFDKIAPHQINQYSQDLSKKNVRRIHHSIYRAAERKTISNNEIKTCRKIIINRNFTKAWKKYELCQNDTKESN